MVDGDFTSRKLLFEVCKHVEDNLPEVVIKYPLTVRPTRGDSSLLDIFFLGAPWMLRWNMSGPFASEMVRRASSVRRNSFEIIGRSSNAYLFAMLVELRK